MVSTTQMALTFQPLAAYLLALLQPPRKSLSTFNFWMYCIVLVPYVSLSLLDNTLSSVTTLKIWKILAPSIAQKLLLFFLSLSLNLTSNTTLLISLMLLLSPRRFLSLLTPPKIFPFFKSTIKPSTSTTNTTLAPTRLTFQPMLALLAPSIPSGTT